MRVACERLLQSLLATHSRPRVSPVLERAAVWYCRRAPPSPSRAHSGRCSHPPPRERRLFEGRIESTLKGFDMSTKDFLGALVGKSDADPMVASVIEMLLAIEDFEQVKCHCDLRGGRCGVPLLPPVPQQTLPYPASA